MKIMKLGLVATLILMLSGCTVNLVSQYDQVTDNAVSDIHSTVTNYFLTGHPEKPGIPPEGKAFYVKLRVKVSDLKFRALSIPNNYFTLQQIDILSKQVDILEKFDLKGFTPVETPLLNHYFDTTCGAILKLELAKKRGQ